MGKYVDPSAVTQVIGCVYSNLSILDNDEYSFSEEDFPDEFYKIIFGCFIRLRELGAESVSLENINDYLAERPKALGVYKANRGNDYLTKVAELAQPSAFNYYYHRLKRMSLLRAYDRVGIDVSFLYDPDNILDSAKRTIQEDWLDNTPIEEIAAKVDEKIDAIRREYVESATLGEARSAGEGIDELIASFEERPDIGVPLYGDFINTVTRGARLGKFYLRSAPTGVGKTRAFAADAAFIGCEKYYDEEFGWISSGIAQPTLFIATEQDLSEIQTLLLSFIAAVNEDHIIMNKYEDGERERVKEAANIIKNSPLFVEELPEFNLQDVENIVKRNIRQRGVKYIFLDYIHSNLKILEEISRRAGKIALREDNILFMISAKLKEICVEYGVFIFSGTQVNGKKK